MYYILFFLCISSRLVTSIFFIEDIDSLRFALSVVDKYSVTDFQPHFPGYPIFCFLANLLYSLTNNLGFSFSIIGGLSTFTIIYYSLKILKFKYPSKESFIISFLIFFNPMIWILGNRYMPDLMGLAILIASFYYIACSSNKLDNYIGLFLVGILVGVRLSFLPMLIIPLFLSKNKIWSKFLLYTSLGVLIWLVPILYIEGGGNLYQVAYKHTIGHFMDYGGTIMTDSNLMDRFVHLCSTIYGDGLGGYLPGRSMITIIISICLFTMLLTFIYERKNLQLDSNLKLLLISSLIYLLWVFFFQNIIYKSRHILPLVYTLVLLIGWFSSYKNKYYFVLLMLLPSFFITMKVTKDHVDGTAISNLKNDLIGKKLDYIISNSLVNFYLKSHDIQAEFINMEIDGSKLKIDNFPISSNVLIVGDYSHVIDSTYNMKLDTVYYHNPYMNRMWSSLPIYSLNGN